LHEEAPMNEKIKTATQLHDLMRQARQENEQRKFLEEKAADELRRITSSPEFIKRQADKYVAAIMEIATKVAKEDKNSFVIMDRSDPVRKKSYENNDIKVFTHSEIFSIAHFESNYRLPWYSVEERLWGGRTLVASNELNLVISDIKSRGLGVEIKFCPASDSYYQNEIIGHDPDLAIIHISW